MSFELPDYLLNKSVITALQRDNLCYIRDFFHNFPWYQDALFYSVQNWKGVGHLGTKLNPPYYCLLTPFTYAVLSGSKHVVRFLLENKADLYKTGHILETNGAESLKYSSRYIELSPIAMCQPTDVGFEYLIKYGYNPQTAITVTTKSLDGEKMHVNSKVYKSYWEFSLMTNKQLANPISLIQFTDSLLHHGYNCNELLKHLDITKCFTIFFNLRETIGFLNNEARLVAVSFMNVFLKHGVCLSGRPLISNWYKALNEIARSGELDDETWKLICATTFLTRDVRHVRQLYDKLQNVDRIIEKYYSLEMICLRNARELFGGQFYAKRVNQLRLSPKLTNYLLEGYDKKIFEISKRLNG